MSRIGKQPIPIPGNVKVSLNGRSVTVESGKNKLAMTHRPEVTVRLDDAAKSVVVERKGDGRVPRAMHGLTRALIANMIQGVATGYTKELEVNGVGWTARVQGKKIVLNIGYADPRELEIQDGVTVEVVQNRIKISGADKQKVGQLAAEIRAQREPEPYNAKGIKYVGEHIVRKSGKQFAGGGA